jgi:AraC family transcriptional regulator of adaptative response/methylated-DNA-[protein]-cysteine methyltransferase
LDAALQAGFGSAGHLYEKVTDQLGMTPSTYRKGGQGMTITYHTLESAFGVLLLAATERGLCAAELHTSPESAEAALAAEFPNAQRVRASDDAPLTAWGAQVMAHVVEGEPLDVPLDVQATAFQWRVWQALQAIPRGQTRTYREVADALGMPTGARAVASACASNRVALVIPCHRVVGASGALTGYKWGVERKRALLDAERGERGLW